MAVISFIAGCLFWISHAKLDREEDELNNLPTGFVGNKQQLEASSRRGSLKEIAEAGSVRGEKDVEMLKTS
jgi:hypothetical protein